MIDKWNELLNCIEMWLWKHVKAAEKSGSHTAVQDHPGPPKILATQGPFEQKAAGNEEKASILHITSRELKIPETLKHLSSGPGFCFFLFLSVSFALLFSSGFPISGPCFLPCHRQVIFLDHELQTSWRHT